jgi:hypothetical protein
MILGVRFSFQKCSPPTKSTYSQEVEIFLPLLGVPASKVELRFRKTETITLQGSKCKPLVDELWHRVVWEWDRRRESTDVYKVSDVVRAVPDGAWPF